MNTAGKSNKQEIIEDIDEEDEEDDFIGSAANVSDDLISDDVRRQVPTVLKNHFNHVRDRL